MFRLRHLYKEMHLKGESVESRRANTTVIANQVTITTKIVNMKVLMCVIVLVACLQEILPLPLHSSGDEIAELSESSDQKTFAERFLQQGVTSRRFLHQVTTSRRLRGSVRRRFRRSFGKKSICVGEKEKILACRVFTINTITKNICIVTFIRRHCVGLD